MLEFSNRPRQKPWNLSEVAHRQLLVSLVSNTQLPVVHLLLSCTFNCRDLWHRAVCEFQSSESHLVVACPPLVLTTPLQSNAKCRVDLSPWEWTASHTTAKGVECRSLRPRRWQSGHSTAKITGCRPFDISHAIATYGKSRTRERRHCIQLSWAPV